MATGGPKHPASVYLDRCVKAISIAGQFGQIDGAHHRAWVIDQMVRTLFGDDEQGRSEYAAWVVSMKAGDDGPDSEFGSPACECETCAQARTALAGGGDAAGRLLASQTRAADLETALAALLDAAERQAAGFPIEAEQWFAARDFARARLPEKRTAGAEEVERG